MVSGFYVVVDLCMIVCLFGLLLVNAVLLYCVVVCFAVCRFIIVV